MELDAIEQHPETDHPFSISVFLTKVSRRPWVSIRIALAAFEPLPSHILTNSKLASGSESLAGST